MNGLKGRTIVVTGAAQGIGAAVARHLAGEGADVCIADVLPGDTTAEAIAEDGGRAIAVECDVTSEDSIRNALAVVRDEFGRLDGLVNNAALFGNVQITSMFELGVDDWDRMMAVNARGPWLMTRHAVPLMEQNGAGAIVNVASNRFFLGVPDLLHYDASKGAVIAITRSMARELGPRGIRINCIAPGLTMTDRVRRKEGIEQRAPMIRDRRPLARDQLPEDLVGVVAFLLGDDSAFMTGQTLVVDGGTVMH